MSMSGRKYSMLEHILGTFGAMNAGFGVGLLLFGYDIDIIVVETTKRIARRLFKKRAKICERYKGEDRISALPTDLLVQILLLLPTKEAVATTILSKRWRFIWTMMPNLIYQEDDDDTHGVVIAGLLGRLINPLFAKRKRPSICPFVDKALQLHKAPVLEQLGIQLVRHCPVEVDVGKWIEDAVVNRKLHELSLALLYIPDLTSIPKSLYTCNTLVILGLYRRVLVDVPSPALLPSLKTLLLCSVFYKDENSIVRLLSSCPVLKNLCVYRSFLDNAKNIAVKVPSLECLWYDYQHLPVQDDGIWWTLVIDCPSLKKFFIADHSGDSCSIENQPEFDKAIMSLVSHPGEKFLTSLSSVKYLELHLNFAAFACCYAINFSQLMECKITLVPGVDWMEPLMSFLQTSPNLKVFSVDQKYIQLEEDVPPSWNQPHSVPECLLGHLEIFEWKEYGGKSEEKDIVRYIFANSRCLKRAGISVRSIYYGNRKKMMKELESMPRISTSSQLLFSTQLEYLTFESEITD